MPKKDLEPGEIPDERLKELKRRIYTGKKLTPLEAIKGLICSTRDLKKQSEIYRDEFARYLRQRMAYLKKHPKKMMMPEEPKVLKFLMNLLALMDVRNN